MGRIDGISPITFELTEEQSEDLQVSLSLQSVVAGIQMLLPKRNELAQAITDEIRSFNNGWIHFSDRPLLDDILTTLLRGTSGIVDYHALNAVGLTLSRLADLFSRFYVLDEKCRVAKWLIENPFEALATFPLAPDDLSDLFPYDES